MNEKLRVGTRSESVAGGELGDSLFQKELEDPKPFLMGDWCIKTGHP